MQRSHSQFGRRKNAASPRRLALRLAMHDVSKDFPQRLAVSPNDSPNAATEDAVLDAAALRSLNQLLLLLDDWDRAMAKNSSQECEIFVDRKTC
jgi:hypothetical protein